MARRVRRATIICLLSAVVPAAEARADWLVVPFFGGAFGGQTNLADFDLSAGSKKPLFGVSVAWLTDGLLGFEGDFSYAPGFFESPLGLVVGSSVSTLTGSVMLTTPLSVTRESLRPYLAGGVGLLHPSSDDIIRLSPVDSVLLAVNVGGGAIGFVSNRTGVRFDLRHIRSVRGEGESLTGMGRARLSFWRATVGVVVRY